MMYCPKCNGEAKVIDTVGNLEDKEVYRKRKCTVCGHVIYTVEIEVQQSNQFKIRWYSHHRTRKKEADS